MTRTFIQTQEFVRNWERLSLDDSELRRLELEILKNPKVAERNNISKMIQMLERSI